MAFHNVPPNGFPDLPDVEELEAVEKDVKTLKTTTSEHGAAITALGTSKAAKADIAPTFSAESNYAVGDLVYYEGTLYECTTEHEAAAWDAENFTAASIDDELSSLKSGLTSVYGWAYSVERRTIDSTGVVEYVIPYDGFYAVQLQSLNTQAHDLYCTLSVNGTPISTPFLSQYVTYQYDKLSTVIPLKAGAVLHAVGAENDVMLIMQMSAN